MKSMSFLLNLAGKGNINIIGIIFIFQNIKKLYHFHSSNSEGLSQYKDYSQETEAIAVFSSNFAVLINCFTVAKNKYCKFAIP